MARKQARRKAGNKPMPGWMIMLSGVLLGLILSVLAYVLGWVPKPANSQDNQPVPGISEQARQEKIEDLSESLKSDNRKDYDFYTLLPEMEVVIPQEDIEQEIAQDDNQFLYVLQVASFKSSQDAEKLKAEIAFNGQIAHIQTIEVNQTQWHRVRIGPFDSSRQADNVMRKLRESGYHAILLKETKS